MNQPQGGNQGNNPAGNQRGNRTRLTVIGAVLLFLAVILFPRPSSDLDLEISQVVEMAQAGRLAEIEVRGDKLTVITTEGQSFSSRKESSVSLLEFLADRDIATGSDGITIDVRSESRSIFNIFLSLLPLIVFAGLTIWMMRRARGGMGQVMSIGRSTAKLVVDKPSVNFSDVAGVDEAKQELAEIVEYLKYPEKFAKLGAKIPRGLLLIGPPGTGKTPLGRAVAGEAGVSFFSISGSEFVEMFVGVGASRVRDLFEQARANQPAIVFIDEIDAVGRHRGAGIGGGNDEREQTLNQILVQMDGFEERTNVIVIAATNRTDVLDPALLRPGRFDRRVLVDLPDVVGREAILKVHMRGKPVAQDLDLASLARQTHGFSGADLANLLNEAAILAARQDRSVINLQDLEESIDRVTIGPASKSRKVSDREREIVAYHEAGHALVAAALPAADPVHKVTIVAHGWAGGFTRMLPEEDRALWSKGQFEAMLAVMMGGQTAEGIPLGDITTGASNDLQNASNIARKMVTEFGMSDDLGPRTFGAGQDLIFLGKELAQGPNYSDDMASRIDSEIEKFLCKARDVATRILEGNRANLTRMAKRLISDETLDGPELQELLANSSPEPLPLAAGRHWHRFADRSGRPIPCFRRLRHAIHCLNDKFTCFLPSGGWIEEAGLSLGAAFLYQLSPSYFYSSWFPAASALFPAAPSRRRSRLPGHLQSLRRFTP